MVERTPVLDAVTHALILVGILLTCLPVYVAVVAATQSQEQVNALPMSLIPGRHLLDNLALAWAKADLGLQLWNSFVQASGIAVGKITISMLSAFAVVYFRFRGRMLAFVLILVSLMLPVEVRIVPTYEVAANAMFPLVWLARTLGLDSLAAAFGYRLSLDVKLSLLNSYAGLILPLIASATATFLFRQFFMTVPRELAEAARIDGAGPLQFFWHILLPLSRTNIAALGVIMFIFGWNQFLWPLLVTTEERWSTIVVGIARLMPAGVETVPEWNVTMAAALIAMAPPVIVILVLQRLFVKGLVEIDK